MKILTFDIEDWFHILDNDSTKTEEEWTGYESRIHSDLEKILSLLEKHNLKATFFCLGWIAFKYPEVVRTIISAGHEVGCHSTMHQLVYEQSKAEFKEDLLRSMDILQSITGNKVKYYRAPGFSIKENNNWALELLAENGIEYDSSIFPASRGHGGYRKFSENSPSLIKINGAVIKEFPINTVNIFGKRVVFSGGGYFRFFPTPILYHYFKTEPYIMTYFHPRDFDTEQPIIKELNLIRRFKSYYGLKGAFPKLDYLLSHYDFVDIKTASAKIDWEKVNKVVL
jgi:polysaccharide deacetylase family protein (PEP-CTERM system associated)